MPEKRGADKREQVQVFVSYARADSPTAVALLRLLKQNTSASRAYRYRFWKDTDDILIGERWNDAIQGALKECDLGLLLLSPAFLGSDYIENHELPDFWGGGKAVVPVRLKPFNDKRQCSETLKRMQIFSVSGKHNKPKAFSQCAGPGREDFVLRLFDRIEKRLRATFEPKRRSARS
jgi:hypothetical protein